VFRATITVAGETKAILKLGYLNRTDKEQILIADLPIRNARKSSALNKSSVSNRQKRAFFDHLPPTTRNLPPAFLIATLKN